MEILVAKVPIEKISGDARTAHPEIARPNSQGTYDPAAWSRSEEMPIASALALSAEKRVKRLPVVNADGELIGIVGRSEMMRALLA